MTSYPPPESQQPNNLSLGAFLCLFHSERHWPLIAINQTTKDIQAADFPESQTRDKDTRAWATNWNNAGYGIYFGVNPLKETLGRKASKEDVLEARWMWADCDPPDGSSGSDLEAWRADKLAEIRAGKEGVPLHTIIVDSGRGFWAFWRLRKPEPVDGRGLQTVRVESFGRGIAEAFDADNGQNIERIARLPGFINHKTRNEARVVEYHAEREYDLADFPSAPLWKKEDSIATSEEFHEFIDDNTARATVTNYLTGSAPLAVERQGGRATTMGVLQKCQDFGCSLETSLEFMEQLWSDRCLPPWEPDDIEDTFRGLRRNDPIGCEHPEVVKRKRSLLAAKHFEPIVLSHRDQCRQSPDELLLGAWLQRKLPPRDYLLGNVLCSTSRWLIWGDTGVGKTLLACDLGGAIAAGAPFLNWERRRRARVMYLDGEMPAETFKERMELVAAHYGSDIPFYGYNREILGPDEMPPLNTTTGEAWLWREIDAVKPDAIIFDSIMCLLAGSMSEEESWQPVKQLIRKISSRPAAQIWLHHTGHDTTKAFGTKTREWEMDTVASLTKQEKGRGVLIDFRKARLRTPQTRSQFEARIIVRGEAGWTATDDEVGKTKSVSDIDALMDAILEAYDRLAEGAETSLGIDGEAVTKVSVDTLREELKSRGMLATKESGGLTEAARTSFHRAKVNLLSPANRRLCERDGLIWKEPLFKAPSESKVDRFLEKPSRDP